MVIHMEDGDITVMPLHTLVTVAGDPTGTTGTGEIKIGAIGIDGMLQANGIGEIDGAHPATGEVMATMATAQVMVTDIMVLALQDLLNLTLEVR